MQTLILNKYHFGKKNVYIGSESVHNFDGHIKIESNLGTVHFPGNLRCAGNIETGFGTGIKVDLNIEPGYGISVGAGITAINGNIIAGGYIRALWDINVDGYISAGNGYAAGDGIIAGYGISAKQEIKCGKTYFVLAGVNACNNLEYEVRCTKLIGGTVKLGKLVLIQPEIVVAAENNCSVADKIVEIEGKKYKFVLVD